MKLTILDFGNDELSISHKLNLSHRVNRMCFSFKSIQRVRLTTNYNLLRLRHISFIYMSVSHNQRSIRNIYESADIPHRMNMFDEVIKTNTR